MLDQLGPLVLRHTGPPGYLDRAVGGVVIDDAAFGAPLSPGCAVLGVGAGSQTQFAALIDRAGAAGATAVFVKRAHEPQHDAVAVVEVAADLAWEQLHAFVRTALLPVTETRPGGPQTLFDVANAVAVRVDGAVVIEDEHLRVVAYSTLDHEIDDARRATILGRQIPEYYVDQIREAGVTAHLDTSAAPVRFDLAGPGLLPRLAVALRSGGRMIGLLWAITDDEREANATKVLADSAPDIAVELLRHLTADASLATDRLAAASRLLEGRPVPNLRQLLGSEPTDGFVALALRPVGAADAETLGRVARFATVYVDAYRTPALIAPLTDGHVDVVLGLSRTTGAAQARVLLDDLRDRTRATFGIELVAAMGAPVPDVRGVPVSRRDALAVLDVLGPGGGAASYDEVQAQVTLRELRQVADGTEHLRRGPVARMMRAATGQQRRVIETVQTYLDAGGDVGRTATALGVHRNTVRYRVSKFEAVTGLDLADPDARLVAQLQLVLTPPV